MSNSLSHKDNVFVLQTVNRHALGRRVTDHLQKKRIEVGLGDSLAPDILREQTRPLDIEPPTLSKN